MARRGNRAPRDARLGEPRVRAPGIRDRSGRRADDGRPSRPCLLGAVVPGQLGLGDAGADPPLVLLHLVHVRDAHRPLALRARAHLREAARRDRARDAPLVGELDRGRRRGRPHGGGRHALAVQRAASESEPPLRLRPRPRDQATSPDPLELGEVPHRLREHRWLAARLGRSRRWAGWRAAAARSLAGRPHQRLRRGGDRGVRDLVDGQRRARFRRVRRRPVQLVHPALSAPLLGWRRGSVSDTLVRARSGHPGRLAGHAVSQ